MSNDPNTLALDHTDDGVTGATATIDDDATSSIAAWLDGFRQWKVSRRQLRPDPSAVCAMILKVLTATVEGSNLPLQPSKGELAKFYESFCAELKASRCPGYAVSRSGRLERMLEFCGGDLSPAGLKAAEERLRAKAFCPSVHKSYLDALARFADWIRKRGRDSRVDAKWESIDSKAIERGLLRLMEQEWSPATCVNALKHVKEFFGWLSHPDRGLIQANPAEHVSYAPFRGKPTKERTAPTDDDVEKLIAAAVASASAGQKFSGVDRAAIYATVCSAGLWLCDLTKLSVGDFLLDAADPIVRVAGRDVPLLPVTVKDSLLRYFSGRGQKEAAFPRLSDGRYRDALGHMLVSDAQAAGISKARMDFGALRLVYGFRAFRAGASLVEFTHWHGKTSIGAARLFLSKTLTDAQVAQMATLRRPRPLSLSPARPPRLIQGNKGGRPALLAEQSSARLTMLAEFDQAAAKGVSRKEFCGGDSVRLATLKRYTDWRNRKQRQDAEMGGESCD